MKPFQNVYDHGHGIDRIVDDHGLWHRGDPCVYCGAKHDDVPPGPCVGRMPTVELADFEPAHPITVLAACLLLGMALGISTAIAVVLIFT